MSKKQQPEATGKKKQTDDHIRCRCGHEWIAQGKDRPRVCPKCKSANWDKPKKWEWKD